MAPQAPDQEKTAALLRQAKESAEKARVSLKKVKIGFHDDLEQRIKEIAELGL